jgi:hypothetical protein
MAGYTQAELVAIFSASGVADRNAQRRLANILTKAYIDVGVIRVVETTGGAGAPKYNYNTRKYFAAMARPLIELATACYGQGYTAAQITALAKTEAYGPLSYTFATYAPDIVQATFACMESGGEILTSAATFAADWTGADDYNISGEALRWTRNTDAGTFTQLHAAMNHALLTNSAWYVFDFEVAVVASAPTAVTKIAITAGLLTTETSIITYDTAGIGTLQKASAFVKAKTDTSVSDFVISGTSNGATGAYKLDNFSLKEIPNSAFSTNPLSNFTATQAQYYGSLGSNYCKKFIAAVVTTTLQKMAEGEYGVYGTINKIADPVLDTWTT